MRKLKVVQFTPALGFGGTEKTLLTFCKYLDKDKFDVSVCVFELDRSAGKEKVLEELGIDLRVSSPRYLGKYLSTLNADIFHIHRAGWAEEGAITAAKEAGIQIVVEHNVFGRLDTSRENEMIDCHILISYSCAARYQMWLGKPLVGPRYEVLYYPLDIDNFDKFGFDDRDYGVKAVGRIGRPDNTKWEFTFLSAAPAIVAEVPECKFHIIGITPEAHRFFEEKGIADNLVLHPMTGVETEIMSFLKGVSLFTHFASMGETFGLTLAEAMAAKLPVVTHYTPHPKDSAQAELVSSGYNGFVAQNPEQYASAVVALLNNPENAKRVGLNGYNKARSLYDAKSITTGLEDIFLHLCDKSPAK